MNKKLLYLLLAAIMLTSVILPTAVSAADGDPQTSTNANPGYVDRGPMFIVVEQTLAHGGPVVDDFIKRSLFTQPQPDGKGNMTPGVIKIGEIQKLVDAGTFHIGASQTLEVGSQP